MYDTTFLYQHLRLVEENIKTTIYGLQIYTFYEDSDLRKVDIKFTYFLIIRSV